ncbi:MAG: MAPEG family protein [Candidatus Sericytochromatia bacterium]
MTLPLWCLFVASLLPYVCAGIGAYYRLQLPGGPDNKEPRQQVLKLEGPGARAYAAQQNAWEALALFSAAVLINHLAHGEPGSSATAALIFVAARVLHPVLYVLNQDKLRSLSWAVGFGCCMWLIGLGINAAH